MMMFRMFAVAALAALMAFPGLADTPLAGAPEQERLSSRQIGAFLRNIQQPVPQPQTKPGMGVRAPAGPTDAQLRAINLTRDDTCRWANDGECDDPRWGTGACTENSDFSDCWRVALGMEDDSCQWANDGECDDPGIGTGACVQGTDATDCAGVAHLRNQTDSCEHAFNGVCDEPGTGTGLCPPRTDRSDCIGRERPLTINDHFFGHDDRVLMDTAQFPWSVIGEIDMEVSGKCTASLIGPDIIVTAAHCIHSQGRLDARGVFRTAFAREGGPLEARVTGYLISPNWDHQRFSSTNDIDGTDWALLRLNRRLGDELGWLGVEALVRERGVQGAMRARIYQAGYSWDTGDNLSGNLDCRILEAADDDTISHDCDTTRGDSGSPFMVRENGEYFVIATDSNFRRNPDGPMIYIATRTEGWVDYLPEFAAGRIGIAGPRPAGPGKPSTGQDPNLPAPGK